MGTESRLEDRPNCERNKPEIGSSVLMIYCQVGDARKSIRETDATIAQKAREAEGKVSSFTKDTVAQAEKSANQTGKEAHDAIDKFDKTVERKTSEAKSGIASWLGFGK